MEKSELFINSSPAVRGNPFWVSSRPLVPRGLDDIIGRIYFREGSRDLHYESPTWFPTEESALEALEAMGFRLAEQPR